MNWKSIKGTEAYYIEDEDGLPVVGGLTKENARLISAVPDLLLACKLAIQKLEEVVSILKEEEKTYNYESDSLLDVLKKAVQRAEEKE